MLLLDRFAIRSRLGRLGTCVARVVYISNAVITCCHCRPIGNNSIGSELFGNISVLNCSSFDFLILSLTTHFIQKICINIIKFKLFFNNKKNDILHKFLNKMSGQI